MPNEVVDRNITINGLRLHYREWGRPDSPAVVMLAGWGDNAHAWDEVASMLADRWRLIALDQRGHGESESAKIWEDYSGEHRTSDLAALINALGLKEPALIGHSSGGAVPCTFHCASEASQISKLVIADAGPGPRDPADSVPPPNGVGPTGVDDVLALWATVLEFDDPEVVYAESRGLWIFRHFSDAQLRRRFEASIQRLENGRWAFRQDAKLRPRKFHLPAEDVW